MPDAVEERLSALAADLQVPVPDGLERAVMDRVASDASAPGGGGAGWPAWSPAWSASGSWRPRWVRRSVGGSACPGSR